MLGRVGLRRMATERAGNHQWISRDALLVFLIGLANEILQSAIFQKTAVEDVASPNGRQGCVIQRHIWLEPNESEEAQVNRVTY